MCTPSSQYKLNYEFDKLLSCFCSSKRCYAHRINENYIFLLYHDDNEYHSFL